MPEAVNPQQNLPKAESTNNLTVALYGIVLAIVYIHYPNSITRKYQNPDRKKMHGKRHFHE